jgi:hypothetical protein
MPREVTDTLGFDLAILVRLKVPDLKMFENMKEEEMVDL